ALNRDRLRLGGRGGGILPGRGRGRVRRPVAGRRAPLRLPARAIPSRRGVSLPVLRRRPHPPRTQVLRLLSPGRAADAMTRILATGIGSLLERNAPVPDPEPYIDAHSHIWTPDVAHYPLAEGFAAEGMKPRSFTAEELLATCRPAGV